MAELNAAGNITGTDGTVELATGDNAAVSVALEGTWNATVNFEVTYDGVRWDAAQVFTLAGVAAASTATTNVDRLIDARGAERVRARANPFVLGPIGVVLSAGEGVVGGGGGGGAVTVADGADVAQGTTTDAAVVTNVAGTVIGFLRGLVTLIAARLPAALVGGRLDVNIGAAPATVPVSAASLPLPTGAAADATLSTTNTEVGGLTEAAPATDIASSGLNGRLQRVAQRLTSLITLLPGALVSGRLDVNLGAAPATVTAQGAAAAGAALAGNPLLMGISDGTAVQNLKQSPATLAVQTVVGVPLVQLGLYGSGGNQCGPWGTAASQGDNSGGSAFGSVAGYVSNGGNFDKVRNNVDVTDLASASRTTTQTLADIVVYNGHSLIATLDMTVVGTGSVTLTINYKDPASGKYILLLSSAAIITNITTTLWVNDKAIPATPAPYTKSINTDLGRIIQLVVTANNANAATYSLGHTVPC